MYYVILLNITSKIALSLCVVWTKSLKIIKMWPWLIINLLFCQVFNQTTTVVSNSSIKNYHYYIIGIIHVLRIHISRYFRPPSPFNLLSVLKMRKNWPLKNMSNCPQKCPKMFSTDFILLIIRNYATKYYYFFSNCCRMTFLIWLKMSTT